MSLDERQLQAIVDAVVNKLAAPAGAAKAAPAAAPSAPAPKARGSGFVETYAPGRGKASGLPKGRKGIFESLDDAAKAAQDAHEQLVELPLETRKKIVQAMRESTAKNVQELAQKAVDETGLGRVEDKVKKNLLVAWKTPGVEILGNPETFTGDYGLAITERAPYGVIGAITPTTNPTETILNNAIGMVAGGNAVVFNVHPSAKNISRWHVELINEAIVSAGGPENLVTCLAEPTIQSAQALMKHPGTRMTVVTGGPAVVKAALGSGKRAICAGPGNPPAVVDETAILDRAARDIVRGASLDNNIVCIVEKEVIAVASIADELKRKMVAHGAFEVTGQHIARLEELVVLKDGHPNKEWVGKDAAKIARAAGFHVPEGTRLLFAEVGFQHAFIQGELLMPVIGFTRAKDVDEAIDLAVEAEHGFGHTATMHSQRVENLHAMARAINTSIFVKNGPSYAGLGLDGEGYTSFTIASPTGEGLTTARSFTRERRCTLKDYFRIT